MRFMFLDDAYPEAYATWKATGGPLLHGTAAGWWDIALRAAGHESETYLANDGGSFSEAIKRYHPDVVCVQNVGRWVPHSLDWFSGKTVAFCSYAASDENMSDWDCLFTSFPWLVEELRGQRCEYMPLAFGRPVLDLVEAPERDLPLVFVGGLGNRIWRDGTQSLARVAEEFPEFTWYGYKVGSLPESLQRAYQGPAWGADYFRLLMRAKIVINRHGEIARGYANNLRLFEATGCGACLLTESAPNLGELFTDDECVTYNSDELIGRVRWLLDSPVERERIAGQGRTRTLRDHCYENRVTQFLEVVGKL